MSLVHNQISVWFLHLISGAVIVLLNCFCFCCCWVFSTVEKLICHKKRNPFRRDWENCSTSAPLIIFILLYSSGWKNEFICISFCQLHENMSKICAILDWSPSETSQWAQWDCGSDKSTVHTMQQFLFYACASRVKMSSAKILSGLQWASLFGL